MNAHDLHRLGLDPNLEARLAPYIGLRRAQAQSYVRDQPFRLAREEGAALDKAKAKLSFSDLADRFNRDSTVGRFEALPSHAQTAIADVYFNLGPNGAPNFWRRITTGDWSGAHAELMNFHDHHRTRRAEEAGLMAGDIQAGALPRVRRR